METRWRRPSTYMLSQNLVCVLGLSWFLRCRNQRWTFRTSQSSCLDKPSRCRESGFCRDSSVISDGAWHRDAVSSVQYITEERGERSNLRDGCKHFLQHCTGLSSSSNAGLNVEAPRAGAGNKPVEVKTGETVSQAQTGVTFPARAPDALDSLKRGRRGVCENPQ